MSDLNKVARKGRFPFAIAHCAKHSEEGQAAAMARVFNPKLTKKEADLFASLCLSTGGEISEYRCD